MRKKTIIVFSLAICFKTFLVVVFWAFFFADFTTNDNKPFNCNNQIGTELEFWY